MPTCRGDESPLKLMGATATADLSSATQKIGEGPADGWWAHQAFSCWPDEFGAAINRATACHPSEKSACVVPHILATNVSLLCWTSRRLDVTTTGRDGALSAVNCSLSVDHMTYIASLSEQRRPDWTGCVLSHILNRFPPEGVLFRSEVVQVGVGESAAEESIAELLSLTHLSFQTLEEELQ